MYVLKDCKSELLNPNLGADIYKLHCPFVIEMETSEKNQNFFLPHKPIRSQPQEHFRFFNQDPEASNQWSLDFLNIHKIWESGNYGSPQFPIAVIDSGLTYSHEDFELNKIVNLNEIPNNGVDDDLNGYRHCRKAPGFRHGDIRHRLERRKREAVSTVSGRYVLNNLCYTACLCITFHIV